MNEQKKIVYIGEVPITPEPGGAILLYRCFDYLNIEFDKIYVGLPKEIYPNVRHYNHPFSRLSNTRFSALYALINFQVLWIILFFKLLFKLKRYNTIYTVSHGVTFKAVYYVCKFWKKDLIIFNHDLYSQTFNLRDKSALAHDWFKKSIKSNFVKNLFVSPYMKELYKAEGEVLFPTRSKSILENSSPKTDMSDYRMYYAGSVHSDSNYLVILNMAKYLNKVGGRLFLYSNLDEKRFKSFFDNVPDNIVFNDFIPQELLITELYANANSLLLIQNFDKEDRIAQEVNFQSKLADYTLVGVPIVIVAPLYASSVQWISQLDKEIGIHLELYDDISIEQGLNDFIFSKEKHSEFGENCQIVGRNYFDIESYRNIFEDFFE